MKFEDIDSKALLARAKYLIKQACGPQHTFSIDLEGDGKYVDPSIVIDNCVGIYWNEDTRIPIKDVFDGSIKSYKAGFQVYTIHYDPGVRYYRDGSGQPPEWDYEDIGEPHDCFERALIEAIKIAIEACLDDILVAEGEEAADQERFELEELIAQENILA